MRKQFNRGFEKFFTRMECWWVDGPWYKRWIATPFWIGYFSLMFGVIITAWGVNRLRGKKNKES